MPVCIDVCVRTLYVAFCLLWGDPTHRLSLTDSLFIATERQEGDKEKKERKEKEVGREEDDDEEEEEKKEEQRGEKIFKKQQDDTETDGRKGTKTVLWQRSVNFYFHDKTLREVSPLMHNFYILVS